MYSLPAYNEQRSGQYPCSLPPTLAMSNAALQSDIITMSLQCYPSEMFQTDTHLYLGALGSTGGGMKGASPLAVEEGADGAVCEAIVGAAELERPFAEGGWDPCWLADWFSSEASSAQIDPELGTH